MFGLFPPSCYLNSADMNIYEYLFLILFGMFLGVESLSPMVILLSWVYFFSISFFFFLMVVTIHNKIFLGVQFSGIKYIDMIM